MDGSTAFRLDGVNQCLWRRTVSGTYERLLLTATEFGVLDHLVERAGRLVTHRELLDAVWPGVAIEPQAVKSKIFHLRRLLGDDPRRPQFIETIARRGYRLVGEIERGGGDEMRRGAPARRLVGRDHAVDELWECLQRARAGTFQLVFVTGEPGIGKTALVRELQRQLVASDHGVLATLGQCVEGFGSKEAFYPVLEAVGALCRGPHGARVVDALALRAPTWLVQFPAHLTPQHRETLRQEILGATRARMLREICEALETVARATPLLIVLEDLHWADTSTLDLLSALARRHAPARIMVVATYRPLDVAGPAHPLNALKRDLVARHRCREIVLQPLDRIEIAQYLAAESPSSTGQEELASLLHDHTEGNPLLMTAVLEHLVERGIVERDVDGWRLRRAAAEITLEVPRSLRDMIGAQIDRLAERDQRILEVAAVAGMSFAPVICAPAADIDAGEFEERCDALARRSHILGIGEARQLPDGRMVQRYAFVHALYREALYERLAPARRATLHRRRAERLAEVFAPALEEVLPQLAHHSEMGADCARAVTYLRMTADVAARRGALEAATANLEHALALAVRLPNAERARAQTEILDALADMYLGTFDPRAANVLAVLRERAAENGLLDAEVKALVDAVYPISWASGERALEVIDRALDLSEAQQHPLARASTRARCMVRRLWIRGWNSDDAAACRLALDDVRRLGAPREVAWHVIDCDLVDLFSSEYRRARRDTTEALGTLAGEEGDASYLSYAHSVKQLVVPWCRILLGEWGEARHELDVGIALAEKNGDAHRRQTLLLSRAWLLLHALDCAGVREICNALLPSLVAPARAPWRRFCLTLAGAAEVGLGNRDGALSRLLTARDEMERHTVLGDWYWRLRLDGALAELWLSAGELSRAREEGQRFLAAARATAERSWQALAWEVNARIALASDDVGGAHELIGHALTAISGVEAPVAGWQAHATAAEVCRARGDVDAAERHRAASCDIVFELAAGLGAGDEGLRQTFLSAEPVARVLVGSSSARWNHSATKRQLVTNDFARGRP